MVSSSSPLSPPSMTSRDESSLFSDNIFFFFAESGVEWSFKKDQIHDGGGAGEGERREEGRGEERSVWIILPLMTPCPPWPPPAGMNS